jgi:LacI family transcriptional regulator
MAKGKTTLADVARLAGVSTTAASFVLGGRAKGISQATSERVWKAAASLSYAKPSGARLRDWTRVACLSGAPERFNASVSFFASICDKLQRLAVKNRLQLFYLEFDASAEEAAKERRIQEMLSLGIETVVSDSRATISVLAGRGFKTVLVQDSVIADCICVHCDDREAGRLAAVHALSNGHRLAGIISPPDMEAHPRIKGFIETFEAEGGSCPEGFRWTLPFDPSRAAERIARFVEGRKRLPSLFLCLSDANALPAIRGFAKAGLKVPDDISIIGVGNLPWAAQTLPSLTTVDLLPDIFVKRLAEAIHDAMAGESAYSIASPVRLIARETVRRISGDDVK